LNSNSIIPTLALDIEKEFSMPIFRLNTGSLPKELFCIGNYLWKHRRWNWAFIGEEPMTLEIHSTLLAPVTLGMGAIHGYERTLIAEVHDEIKGEEWITVSERCSRRNFNTLKKLIAEYEQAAEVTVKVYVPLLL